MRRRDCVIEGCEKRSCSRQGWCKMHFSRWQRTGTTDPGPLARPLAERFWARVEKTDTCWLWVGGLTSHGYATFAHPGGNYGHRYSYEVAKGPIPDGMHIDHTCHVRRCVNPAHLQAVTLQANIHNHTGAQRNSKTGIRGVSWSNAMKKWQACAEHHGEQVRLYFDDIEDARAAAIELRNRLHTNNLLDRRAVQDVVPCPTPSQ